MNYSERLFRMSHGFRKGDDPVNETASSADTNQTDNRVGASENGTAIGSGAFNDQSFKDESITQLITTDNSDRSQNFSDNSVHNDVSASVVTAALTPGADVLGRAASVLEQQIAASQDALSTVTTFVTQNNGQALKLVGDSVESLLAKSAASSDALAKQQTDFLKGFYTDRENSDVKVIDGLAKNATAALVVGAIAWALKS